MLISILITLLIAALICGFAFYILRLIPLPSPFGEIVQALIVLIFVIVLIYALLPLASVRFIHG